MICQGLALRHLRSGIGSGGATPGPARAQARAKLVCALVDYFNSQFKAQVPVITRFFFTGYGGRRVGISNS